MERLEVFIDNGRGRIQLFSGEEEAGKMDISIAGDRLTVYHTEVSPAFEGKGFGSLLLNKLVAYAREKELKIVPLCPFVHAKFKRKPDEFQDVWYQRN